MDNAFGLTFDDSRYDDDDRIIIDPRMAGSDSDVRNWSAIDKEQAITDMMEWADLGKDWFAGEMDDYFTQIFKDNGYTKYTKSLEIKI